MFRKHALKSSLNASDKGASTSHPNHISQAVQHIDSSPFSSLPHLSYSPININQDPILFFIYEESSSKDP